MKKRQASDQFLPHSHRAVVILSYLLILVVLLRRRYDLTGSFIPALPLGLLGLFLLLFATEPILATRIKSYHRLYFSLQVLIALFIGLFRDYQDTWALLYVILGFQVAARCARKEAMTWFGIFIVTLLITLLIEFGLISGLGRGLAYIMIGVLIISYNIQYAQHAQALAESQTLVDELKVAHQKLAEHASQAEALAAIQQRNSMIQELYDSVGQKIFAIQLAAESTRLMLARDPGRAAEQIDALQIQTQAALGQMRQLIDQWRPG